MERPEYRILSYVQTGGVIGFSDLQEAREEAAYISFLRPPLVHVIRKTGGEIIALYINGQRFEPVVKSETKDA